MKNEAWRIIGILHVQNHWKFYRFFEPTWKRILQPTPRLLVDKIVSNRFYKRLFKEYLLCTRFFCIASLVYTQHWMVNYNSGTKTYILWLKLRALHYNIEA